MKKLTCISVGLLFLMNPAPGHSENNKDPQLTVEVDTNVYPLSAFQKDGVHAVPKSTAEDQVPTAEERDRTFAKVKGLSTDIASWDKLDKDLLYIRARALKQNELDARYPKISAKKLQALHAEFVEKK